MSYVGNLFRELVPFTVKLLMVFVLALVLVAAGSTLFFNSARNVVSTTEHQMSVEGKAKRKVTPDSAVITLGKIVRGNNIADLQNKAADAINQLTTKLKAVGIQDNQIRTDNYNINPTYNSNGDVKDYEIRISVRVTMEKVNPQNQLLSKVIQAGSDAGINEVYGLNFYLADADKVAKEMENEAIADAKTTAEKRAQSIGASLGKAVSVSVGNNGGPIPYAMGKADAVAAPDTRSSLQFNAGEFDLETNVTVVYELN